MVTKSVKSAIALVALLLTSACTAVPPGYAGIQVDQYGSQKGVKDFPIKTGRVWYNPLTQDIYTFPTYQQNVVWAKKEDSPDNSLTVNSSEGAVLNFDVSLSVAFIGDSVPKIFQKFRKDESHIMEMFIRPQVRKAFSDRASQMTAVSFFGQGKRQVQDSVLADLRHVLGVYGIEVASVEIVGEIRVDNKVKQSIAAVLEAAQKAIEAQNKVVQATAEGEQRVAAARADSTAAVVKAAGQARANELLQGSVTPLLLQKQLLEKWNGVLPTYQGGGSPMITLPAVNRP